MLCGPSWLQSLRSTGMHQIISINIFRDRLRSITSFFLLTAVVAANLATNAQADITLPKLFSDHMVLQRNSEVPVWGTASPNESLEVTFGDQVRKVTAKADGQWLSLIHI